jgi:CRP-like cAMP-binding protein
MMDPFEYESDLEEYSAGDTIFRTGDEGDRMYVVASGKVEIMVGETVVELVEASGILGEMALLGSRTRSATAVAVESCRLLPIDEAFFLHLVQQSPRFSLKVMNIMADRLRRSNLPRH